MQPNGESAIRLCAERGLAQTRHARPLNVLTCISVPSVLRWIREHEFPAIAAEAYQWKTHSYLKFAP
jgi:hypothetical protein